jgi:AcrR family transcriptional regulator
VTRSSTSAAPQHAYDVSGLTRAPQQRRSQELSLRILKAAELVLRRDGAEGFAIGAVAKAAGVSVGGIYGRFRDRDELVSAIHSHMLKRVLEVVGATLSRPFASVADMAQAFAEVLIDFFEYDGSALAPLIRNLNPVELGATQARINELVAGAIAPFAQDMAHRNPDEAVRFLVQLVLACVTREVRTQTSIGWATLRQELPQLVRAYVEPPASGLGHQLQNRPEV